jgi:CheY-like chemotaxis protein
MNAVSEHTSTVSILVLEDDPVHRLLLEHEFQGNRYALQSVGDAAVALHLIRSGDVTYHVGIFDLKVPSEAGDFPKTEAALSVIEAARQAFPKMTIVTISSIFLGEDLRSRLEALGVRDNFPKPFSLEKLHEYVDACLP